MEIIISHTHLDLDGIASMILAKKLYPNAKLVFSGNVNANVLKLATLYQDYLHIHKAKEIKITDVTKIILTDIANINRIGKFKKYFEKDEKDIDVVAYDHHINDKNNLTGENILIQKRGSATTILLEELLLLNKDMKLEKYEATIAMMGIYEDTGFLSYTTTTPEDIDMAAYLLRQNANLEMVNEYINTILQKQQLDIFMKLLESGEIIKVSLDSIFIGVYYSNEFVDGIDGVTNKIKNIEGVDGAFIIIGDSKKAYIIGRSSSANIRVDKILAEFGGGGHFNAGSATVKECEFENLKIKLKKILMEKMKINKSAKDIMKTPVKTVHQETKLKDVYKIMLRFGYNGLPILENEEIRGIISRRDLDKAISHGFGNSPVRAYMTSKVITEKLDAPIERLKELIIENEIGRIPILNEKNQLAGIITRSDILRTLYNQRKEKDKEVKSFFEDIQHKIQKRMPDDIYEILENIESVSQKRKEKVYLVGGIVRDLLLNIKNDDIDIVVEGNGIEFAKELGEKMDAIKVVKHHKFGTGVVILKDDIKIDVATSRIEYYEYPTSLPTVEAGSIRQDLYRRDFTINSMAVQIDYSDFGKLLDYFRGYDDLQAGKIKILHNFSFIEDPTRIIRAIRFASRYDFEIDEDTDKFIRDCVKKGFLHRLTWKRVKYEFQLIFGEKNVKNSIYKLFDYGVMGAINEEIKMTDKLEENLNELDTNFEYVKKLGIKQWIIYFLLLLEDLDSKTLNKIFDKFVFPEKFILKYTYGIQKRNKIFDKLKNIQNNSKIYMELKNISDEILILLLVTNRDNKIKENIVKYIDELKDIKPIYTGKELIELGYTTGPKFKEILEKLFIYQLDNGCTKKGDFKDLTIIRDIIKG